MNRRKQIGSSIWLLYLLAHYAPEGWDGLAAVVVALGNAVSDQELGSRLGVRTSTIATWRRKLHKANLLRWTNTDMGRVFVIAAVKALFVPESAHANHPGGSAVKDPMKQSLAIVGSTWTN